MIAAKSNVLTSLVVPVLGISWKEDKIHNFIVRVSFRPTRVIDVKLHLVSCVLCEHADSTTSFVQL